MRAYWEIARQGYRRTAAYRGATLAGFVTNTVFGLMRGYVLAALAARPRIAGWDSADALTYVWLTQGLATTVYIWSWNQLAERIASGDVAVDLGRPIDLQGQWLAWDLGRATYHLIFRGIPPVVVGALLFGIRFPSEPLLWLAFAVSLVLAVIVSFAIRFLANLWSFWVMDWRGPIGLATVLWTVLSGFVIPISFVPGPARIVIERLPFVGMVQTPIEVFLGKHHGLDLLAVLGLQLAWAVTLLALGRVVLSAGTRRLVIQGG